MRILAKFPSRQRPAQLKATLCSWRANQESENVTYLISLDENDPTLAASMNAVAEVCPQAIVKVGTSAGKIHAINRDMEHAGEWDVLVLISDDMRIHRCGWDKIVMYDMERNFPKLDGALHYPDGIRQDLITLSIMGRTLYQAFGYIYHPDYLSLWCDNEFTDSVKALGRYKYNDIPWYRHHHCSAAAGIPQDDLYRRNESHFSRDEAVYLDRKARNFDIELVRSRLNDGA